jgi:diaminopimelate epimerase
MGNPHFVMFVKEFAPDWQKQATEISLHADFKQGMNVELVRTVDKENIEVRFLERGVGETQSSGTGSSAAAVASIATYKATSPLRIHTPGGLQAVRWETEVFLRGPAQIICEGAFFS